MNPLHVKSLVSLLLCCLVALVVAACGGGGSSGGGGQGTLTTLLTDASADGYQAVYVTIARVDVHLGGNDGEQNWQTVAQPNKTYNLLELVNGVRETLGIATLGTGHYTQLRLIIGATPDTGLNLFSQPHPYANYVIDLDDDEIHELKVPSGPQTGLKVVGGFDINNNQTTELILDFDAMRSVVKAGASGQYLLKPTVKTLTTDEYAIVEGTVTDEPPVTTPPTTATALPGTLVTAQTTDPTAADAKDQVVIETGTVASGNGEYVLFLKAASYNLVATLNGYLPECVAVSPATDSLTTVDFSLAAPAAAPGAIAGTVAIEIAPGDQYATIDFRQASDCGGGATTITVKSVNIGDGGGYQVDLPAGNYTVVASTFGKTTRTAAVVVAAGATTLNDITFVSP